MCRKTLIEMLGGVLPPDEPENLFMFPVLDFKPPITPVYQGNYTAGLVAKNISVLAGGLDFQIGMTDKESLDKIAPYLVIPANYYVNEYCDCDDYAYLAAELAAFNYHVSAIRPTIGDTAGGVPHAFLVVIDTAGELWCLEPNAGALYAGQWLKPGETHPGGYIPKTVVI